MIGEVVAYFLRYHTYQKACTEHMVFQLLLARYHMYMLTFFLFLQVPAAIKSLYAQPIADVLQVLPLSDSLLTPEEDVERWRMEEEANRRQVTAYRQPTITHDQDEVWQVVGVVDGGTGRGGMRQGVFTSSRG